MRWNGILLIVQKTKNVEPGCPAQHFFLQLDYITNGIGGVSQSICFCEG
jgi:hypothetical protein